MDHNLFDAQGKKPGGFLGKGRRMFQGYGGVECGIDVLARRAAAEGDAPAMVKGEEEAEVAGSENPEGAIEQGGLQGEPNEAGKLPYI